MTILEALTGTSIDNRRTRNELMLMTGKSDRAVRVEIHKLRNIGHDISTDTKKGGYWLGAYEDWSEFTQQENRRAKNTFIPKRKYDERQLRIV